MGRRPVPADRKVSALAAAEVAGTAKACREFKITPRTLRRWRAEVRADPPTLKRRKGAELPALDEVFRGFLVESVDKLRALVAKANDPSHIRMVAEATRIVGDILTARTSLGLEERGARSAASQAAGAAATGNVKLSRGDAGRFASAPKSGEAPQAKPDPEGSPAGNVDAAAGGSEAPAESDATGETGSSPAETRPAFAGLPRRGLRAV